MSKKLKVIALVCERSVNFSGHLDENQCLRTCDDVRVVQVPCSGIIQPSMIEASFKGGADGVITTGCRIGDCYYREGNKFLKERLEGTRPPKLKPTTDRKKLRAYWLSALELNDFSSMAQSFVSDLQAADAASAS